jgi:hypothetical protein
VICQHQLHANGLISITVRRYVRNFLQTGILTFVFLVLFLFLGAELEGYQVRRSAGTLKFYQQPQVCGIVITRERLSDDGDDDGNQTGSSSSSTIEDNVNTTTTTTTTTITSATTAADAPPFQHHHNNNTVVTGLSFATYESQDAVLAVPGGIVGHCGGCGKCSNPIDVAIYDNTRTTLFAASTTCAKRALIWGRVTASNCLEDAVGFTDECNDCWVENIICDLRRCIFTCLLYGMFGDVDKGSGGGGGTTLNACTRCDERRCGPAFIACAGANRRRCGIVSDISRNEQTEVCQLVHDAWWQEEELQDEWRRNGGGG